MKQTIFSPADILLPKNKQNFTKWAVIACDQFTSEGEYWAKVREISNGAPSAHNLVLPEAYLNTDREEAHKAVIESEMQKVGENTTLFENSLIYVCRTLPDGKVRHGIVGKIDLEEYQYTKKSDSAVRATEATAENTCRVGQHRIMNLADTFRCIVPCLVHKVRVGTYRIYFYTE
jgi:hypothetical protein